ncbi:MULTISPECIES: GNAT family N-acetyltransferase [unclassified Flavobacterium]|uniref:GNAT family N-acetyltransferase n=1 Tax=unclassified Flavobacterium TaxID=196869 RepID=UPI00086E0850|nr:MULTISPECIES: GNAT family N-acetyltransferase [unclassified Flavobacterium]MBN9284231.1 GNAT family N-acetyltransferase [Flavobacterium sp.]ODS80460.1 MAG: GNAT family N-acetyltransferase [Chryseobacterium sp. SCN 40-13]OJV70688.1 MAG: GNAT family N-acetyltransferase [Flavobacterium sp. 40-81]
MNVIIVIAQKEHYHYAQEICDTIETSALQRGTGIAKRTPEYIHKKIDLQEAVIALENGKFAGFCYIESWQHGKFVAHSGLIVHPGYRHLGLAKKIKTFVFEYSQKKYPEAKIFGITTGLAVMKINSDLGYRPVPFSELTDDPSFWAGCKTCTNFDILQHKENKMCLCTGMLYDPKEKKNQEQEYTFNKKVLGRLKSIKQALFLKK